MINVITNLRTDVQTVMKLGRSRRASACAAFLACYVGFALVLGWQLDASSAVDFSIATVAGIAVVSLMAFPFALFVMRFACVRNMPAAEQTLGGGERQRSKKRAKGVSSSFAEKKTSATQFDFDRRAKRTTLLALIIPQVIVQLLVFPGVIGYDSGYHILQFVDDSTSITSRYSVVYTLLLGGCYSFGQSVGSAVFGFALAMVVQAAISIIALYVVIAYVARLTHSRVMFWVALCAVAFQPFAVLLRVSACQDVLFGAFFILIAMKLLELGVAFYEGRAPNTVDFATLAVFSLLMILMRNNGSYVLVVMLVLSIPFLIRYRAWKIAVSIVAALACFVVVSGPVYSACGVQESTVTVREMLSIPSQQLARALNEHGEAFNSEETALYIESYDNSGDFGYAAEDVSWYPSQSELSDVAKSRVDQDFVKSNFKKYAELYVGVGLKCPDSYTNAFLMNTLGFWYPLKSYPDSRMYHPLIEGGSTNVSQYECLSDLVDASQLITHRAISRIMSGAYWSYVPVLSLMLKPGFYLLLLVVASLAIFAARRYEYLPLIALCTGLVATLLLSPVCLFRYVYPLVLATPLLLTVFFKRRNTTPHDRIPQRQ